MKIKILAVLLFMVPQIIFCQEVDYSAYNNSIGISISSISGYGIVYNRKLSDAYQLQLTGLVYYLYSLKDNVEHTDFYYNAGLEIQRNIIKKKNFRFYLLAGGYYSYDDDRREGNGTKQYIFNNSFNAGVGIAGEVRFYRFIFSMDLGYKFFEDRLKYVEIDRTYPEIDRRTKIGLGCSIGFIF